MQCAWIAVLHTSSYMGKAHYLGFVAVNGYDRVAFERLPGTRRRSAPPSPGGDVFYT